MILWKYVDMGEPPMEYWRGHSVTLSNIFDFIGQRPDSSGHRDYRGQGRQGGKAAESGGKAPPLPPKKRWRKV